MRTIRSASYEWVDRTSAGRLATLLFLLLGSIFAMTATWGPEQNVDAIAAALPAWAVAETGSVALPDFALANPWVVESEAGLVSNRPPGVWLLAVPVYLLARPFTDGFSFWPATLTAVLTTAAAMAVVFLVLERVVARRVAVVSTLVLALGTATWPVSSSELWPHGTTQLWLALGMLSLAAGRLARAGLSDGMALLTRPPTAVIAAAQGAFLAWSRRSIRPILAIGIPAAAALVMLLVYNRAVFGEWSVRGGYGTGIEENLAGMSPVDWLANLGRMLVGPSNGVLLWSPVVLVLLFGVATAWKVSSDWVRASFVAGLVYVVIHARLNRASGGMAFNYRYPLPALTLAAPLLATTWGTWATTKSRRRLVGVAVALSIAIQALYVFAVDCAPGEGTDLTCGWSSMTDE